MIYRFDEFVVDATAFEVLKAGKRVDIQPQVIELLILLVQNQDRAVSKDEIFGLIWKNRGINRGQTTVNTGIETVVCPLLFYY